MTDRRTAEIPVGEAELAAGEEAARVSLGKRIRELRTDRGFSGRRVASAIGVSSGFISQIESGATTPSVSTLIRLATVLDVNVGELFGTPEPLGTVLREEDRPRFEYLDSGMTEDRLCAERGLEVTIVTLRPGASSGTEPYTHGSDFELALVRKGTVILLLEGEEYRLGVNDCARFSGKVAHGIRNAGRGTAEVLVAAVTSA